MIEPEFYNDKEIARRLNMSPSWVRGQRHRRANQQPHFLNLEPRRIGTSVRYVVAEAENFIKTIGQQGGHAE